MTSNRGENQRMMRHVVASLLAGATLAAVAGMAGCDSATSEATKRAQKNANEAARIEQSAGELRPKSEFIASMSVKDASEQTKVGKEAEKQIKDDHFNTKEVWKKYLEQRSAAEDLKLAVEKLTEATKLPELNDPSVKGALQEQLGSTAAEQGQVQMRVAEQKLMTLMEKALDIQSTASFLNGLGIEAGVQEKRGQAMAVQDNGALKAKGDEAKAATAKAQQVVDAIEADIATKRAKAADIYGQSDALFMSAEKVKGAAAIEDSKKAVEIRKEADQLTADIVNLQPGLSQAKLDLAITQIKQAEVESQAKAAAAGVERGAVASKNASDHAASLRAEARNLIEGEKGLAAQYKAFSALATDTEKEATLVLGFATTADKAYENSLAQLAAYQAKFREMNLQPTDTLYTLAKVAQSGEIRSMLQLQQASAKEEAGRANLLNYTAENLRAMVEDAMARAKKAAGMGAEAATTGPGGADYSSQAMAQFKAASELADKAKDNMPATHQWLTYTLKAVALHGMYSAGDKARLSEAKEAAQKAKELNPFLSLDALTDAATK